MEDALSVKEGSEIKIKVLGSLLSIVSWYCMLSGKINAVIYVLDSWCMIADIRVHKGEAPLDV